MDRTYIAIDLKSFYASVECADRKYDPLTTNLVVADQTRTEKTICLAVSPSLKAHGISGRARLFEVVEAVKKINAERFKNARKLGVLPFDPESKKYHFTSASFDAEALASDPALELSYIVAPPRMKLYEKISTQVFAVYSKYVSTENIHVYSIDECFLDVTHYLHTYACTAHDLAMQMIREVLYTTGITATAGIGTNLYLCKIAMDIVAKHVAPDKDGVRIAELDEISYRELLWCHRPLTDFWRIGPGIAKRLESIGCFTMGDVARLSEKNESKLYDTLGINAELVIDHAWGWEPANIPTIKTYKPQTNSLSSGQILMEPYGHDKARLIVREMTELLILDLVKKDVVTKKIELTIGYDRSSITYEYKGPTLKDSTFKISKTGDIYSGTVTLDHYGRPCTKHAHGTGNLESWTSSTKKIVNCMMDVYDRIIDSDLTVRRINVVALNLIKEDEIPEEAPEQLNMFTDYAALEKQKEEERIADEKEKRLQKATLAIQEKYGKNSMLKGMNFLEGAITRQRNGQIGGHAAASSASSASTASNTTIAQDKSGVDSTYGADDMYNIGGVMRYDQRIKRQRTQWQRYVS